MKVHNMRLFPWYATGLLILSIMNACSPQNAASAGTTNPANSSVSSSQTLPSSYICNTCGTVRSIVTLSQDGQTTGAGAVIGGIVGGVAGNQVGGGSGQQIATAAGVIGGAVLGNNIERNRNAVIYTDVTVDMDTGAQQTIRVDYPVSFGIGANVNVQGGLITLR
jgi:outer membrane lipoprotein SlyB